MIKFKKKYLIFLIISFIFAKVFGGNLPYGIFYTIIVIGILALIYIPISIKNIDVLFKIDDEKNREWNKKGLLCVGDRFIANLVVENNNFLSIPYIKINNSMFSKIIKNYNGDLIYLKSGERYWLKKEMLFQKRGIYDFGTTIIKVNDWFNIIMIKKEKKHVENVIIYPKIYNISNFTVELNNRLESLSKRIINVKERDIVRDVREYRVGDNVKNIHWKLSAKQNRLYVKNYEKMAGKKVNIIVNMEKIRDCHTYNEEDEELMIDITSSLINDFLKKEIKSKINIKNFQNKSLNIYNYDDFQGLLEYFLRNYSNGEGEFGRFVEKNIKNEMNKSSNIVVTMCISEELKNVLINMTNLGYSITLLHCNKNLYENKFIKELENFNIKCFNLKHIIIN
ncbi:hypothetical protein UT300019_20690 [Clostridium sp. CTA-19]